MDSEQMFEAARVGYTDQKLAEVKDKYDILRVDYINLETRLGLAQNGVRVMRETLASYAALLVNNKLMGEDEIPAEFRQLVKEYREKAVKGEKLVVDLTKVFEEIRVVIPPKFIY